MHAAAEKRTSACCPQSVPAPILKRATNRSVNSERSESASDLRWLAVDRECLRGNPGIVVDESDIPVLLSRHVDVACLPSILCSALCLSSSCRLRIISERWVDVARDSPLVASVRHSGRDLFSGPGRGTKAASDRRGRPALTRAV